MRRINDLTGSYDFYISNSPHRHKKKDFPNTPVPTSPNQNVESPVLTRTSSKANVIVNSPSRRSRSDTVHDVEDEMRRLKYDKEKLKRKNRSLSRKLTHVSNRLSHSHSDDFFDSRRRRSIDTSDSFETVSRSSSIELNTNSELVDNASNVMVSTLTSPENLVTLNPEPLHTSEDTDPRIKQLALSRPVTPDNMIGVTRPVTPITPIADIEPSSLFESSTNLGLSYQNTRLGSDIEKALDDLEVENPEDEYITPDKGWYDEIEEIVEKWNEHAQAYSWMHKYASQVYSKRDKYVSIFSIIFSAAVAVYQTAVINQEDSTSRIISLVLTYSLAAMTSIIKVMNYADSSKKHQVSSLKYQELANDIEYELRLKRIDREDGKLFSKYVKDKLNLLKKEDTGIGYNISNAYKKKYKKKLHEYGFSIPPVANGIEKIKVNRSAPTMVNQGIQTANTLGPATLEEGVTATENGIVIDMEY